MDSTECFVEAQAPVNIAVIKYWGKKDESLKIPINDSLSGTLSIDDMCTTTSVQISANIDKDVLILNGEQQDLSEKSPATKMLKQIRSTSTLARANPLQAKARIISNNNFPTAAGLASSAAGYACLAYALGHAYGVTDNMVLSRIARNGSGSACRSLFGGFVHWVRGGDHEMSVANQVVDESHWPDMRVVICVVNDSKKDVSSSLGMAQSVNTSTLIHHRADHVVPRLIDNIKQAILSKDFETFANITMQDSNQFHAICLDTFPPIFYLNETSKQIIRICHLINSFMGTNKVAYTFDAGPNACIYLLKEFVPIFIEIISYFFTDSGSGKNLEIKGQPHSNKLEATEDADLRTIMEHLKGELNLKRMPESIKYLISTSLGGGPKLLIKKEGDV